MGAVNKCRLVKIVFMIVLLNGSAGSELNDTDVESSISKNNDDTSPTEVDTRFFDLGSLMNIFFPGMNQGNQGRYAGAPGYFLGNQQSQYSNQGIGGGYLQNPNPGNGPTYFDGVNANPGNQYQNQDNQHFGSPNQINHQQYPNQNNFDNQYPPQGTINGGQIPSQGNFGGRPMQYSGPSNTNQSSFGNQFPNTGPVNDGQYQNPGIGYPNSRPSTPDQSNFGNQYSNPGSVNGGQLSMQGIGGPINQYPNSRPAIPNQGNFGNQYLNPGRVNGGQEDGDGGPVNHYPQQGSFQPDQQNFRPESNPKNQDDGTLNTIIPAEQNDFSFPNNQNSNAILGKPVAVSMSTLPPGQIIYPENRTEDPPKKQCSQDCQTSSEYSPICGSNGVTYYNPGRFFCARNCGINVFVMQKGRCASEVSPFTRSPVQ